MLMTLWFFMVGFERLTGEVMMLLMRLPTLAVGELVMLSSMLVVICLGSVGVGTLFFLIFIDFSLPSLELWSIMMVWMVLLLILLCGLLVLFIRGVGCSMRFGTVHFCLGLLVFGTRNGFRFQLLISVLRILLFDLILLVFWLSGSLS